MVEGARLESVYTVTPYRGFESHPLRHQVSHCREPPQDHARNRAVLRPSDANSVARRENSNAQYQAICGPFLRGHFGHYGLGNRARIAHESRPGTPHAGCPTQGQTACYRAVLQAPGHSSGRQSGHQLPFLRQNNGLECRSRNPKQADIRHVTGSSKVASNQQQASKSAVRCPSAAITRSGANKR